MAGEAMLDLGAISTFMLTTDFIECWERKGELDATLETLYTNRILKCKPTKTHDLFLTNYAKSGDAIKALLYAQDKQIAYLLKELEYYRKER